MVELYVRRCLNCKQDTPCGFCFVNNVVVAAAHGKSYHVGTSSSLTYFEHSTPEVQGQSGRHSGHRFAPRSVHNPTDTSTAYVIKCQATALNRWCGKSMKRLTGRGWNKKPVLLWKLLVFKSITGASTIFFPSLARHVFVILRHGTILTDYYRMESRS